MKEYKDIETKVIHAGQSRLFGAVTMPIFQSAMYEHTGLTSYHDVKYIRLNNTPNQLALHDTLASLENGEAAVVAASGMAAISTTLLSVLSAGDHLLAQNSLYGGTYDLITKDFAGFGLSYDLINGDKAETWHQHLKFHTKAIYVETISNPLLQVADLKAVVKFAKEHNLISIIDNTIASPVNFRPLEIGFDIVLHSCTKYLNGHSDIVGGAVISNKALIEKITHKLNHLGGSMDPHAAFLLQRGIKTLALRVQHQNQSALKLAQFLEGHPAVAKVNYPGLESNLQHQRARELFSGYSGMISFELKGDQAKTDQFIHKLKLPIVAPSLGGVESLVTLPAQTSHAGLSPQERASVGISDSLVRFSVGIESTNDLIADFDQALKG